MSGRESINLGLVGYKFIGKAHAFGYANMPFFFESPKMLVKKTLCGKKPEVTATANRWGFEKSTTKWEEITEDPEIDLVDICAPSEIHKEIALAAARNGKHVLCEKPLAMNVADAREMLAAVRSAGVKHAVGFNYRKVPAIGLARKLIEQGRIGQVYHFRGHYSQDWLVNEDFPAAWRLRKSAAGGGASWDLGAHVADLARYLVGEIQKVAASQTTFVPTRFEAVWEDGLAAKAGNRRVEVDVDDATSVLLSFDNGAMGTLEVTRNGTGHRNQNVIEIYGSRGAIIWRGIEKMNELEFYDADVPSGEQGFRTIIVGEAEHPYMSSYWPPGHIIGFGETFTNEIYDFVREIAGEPINNATFDDGVKCQEILAAVDLSVQTQNWVAVADI